MKTWFQKITAGIILVAIVAMVALPGGVLLFPKKAEAQTSCIAGLIMGFISKLIGGLMTVMSIPIQNQPMQSSTASSAGSNFGSWVKVCIIEPMVKALVKEMIHQFLASIVDWINNGFDSSGPRFISDIEGFFADVVDRGVGQMIYGSDLKFLCSPFALDIRLALGLQYWGPKFRDRIRCTLSDVIGNVTSAGDRLAYRNSWQSWLDLTTKPQNNPYGAFALAKSELEIRIANQKFTAGKEADWGSGFLATKRCVPLDPGLAEGRPMSDPILAEGEPICERWETVTPGKLVQEGIGKVVGAQVDEYVSATDIDAIFVALFDQMIGSIFSAAGIFSGTTKGTNYYRNKFESDKAAGVFNVGSGATAPAGVEGFNCSTIGNYARVDNVNVSYINSAVTPPTTRNVKDPLNGAIATPWPDKDTPSSVPPSTTPTSQSQVYSLLTKYCGQLGFWTGAQGAVDNVASSSIPPVNQSGQEPMPSINIAMNINGSALTKSSAVLSVSGIGTYLSSYANDGSTMPAGDSFSFGTAVACPATNGSQGWGEVEYNVSSSVSTYLDKIIIYPATTIKQSGSGDIYDAWNLLNGITLKIYNGAAEVGSQVVSGVTTPDPITINLCSASPTIGCQLSTKIRLLSSGTGNVGLSRSGCVALAELQALNHPRPTISITSEAVDTVAVGGTFDYTTGVEGKDFKGEATAVGYTGTVDITMAGTYDITYTATDSAGVNSNPLVRKITVGSGGGGSGGSAPPPTTPPPPPPLIPQ